MLTRKKGIVSCFILGALLCTLTSCGNGGSTAAENALTVAAAETAQNSAAGTQDIRKTSKEENTREIVKAAIKSTEVGSYLSAPETAVVTIAGASVKSGAADSETTVANVQPVQVSEQSETQPQGTETAEIQSAEGQVQETEIQTQEAESTIAPELENKVITTVDTYQNIRKEPSEDSEIVGHLESGSAGDVLETKDGWTRISSGEVEGWVHNEYVVSGEAAQDYAEESLEQIATVLEEGVRVRAGASVDSTWIGVVNTNEVYQVIPEEEAEPQSEETEGAAEVQTEETVQEEPVETEEGTMTAPLEVSQDSEAYEWVKILYDGETEGYVCAEYVTTSFDLGQAKSMEQIRAEEEAEAAKKSSGSSGSSGSAVSEADSGWVALGEFKITAYCGGACCNGKWAGTTATGASPAEGRTIAVAPWIIPYGSQVKIEGMDGIYVAEDTGGFANSNPYQIDLFVADHNRSGSWGVRYRQVWIKR